jgi:dethiobiotin synthetase
MTESRRNPILFVTGTDTGVGKTLLSGLCLAHLRASGRPALAMKPFCSGGRDDVAFLQALQPGEISDAEMNPWFFSAPVAPLVAARRAQVRVKLQDVVKSVESLRSRCERLIVEGAGGLLAPLGEGFTALDLVERLDCDVVVVARNRLGVINHSLLTLRALAGAAGVRHPGANHTVKTGSRLGRTYNVQLVLMGSPRGDLSARSNGRILAELAAPVRVWEVPFLGVKPTAPAAWKNNLKKVEKTLASVLE